MNSTSIPPRNRGPIVEEIIVKPNAVALPEEATATGPIVEESDLLPLKIIGLGLRTYAVLYPERVHEMALIFNDLINKGASEQTAGAAVLQHVDDVIGPEVHAAMEAATVEQIERYRLIRDPKTRDSITPRDAVEWSIMEAELMAEKTAEMQAESDAVGARVAALREDTRRMNEELHGSKKNESKRTCQVC